MAAQAAAQRPAAPRKDASDDPSSLVGAYVWATPFDDPLYRHERHAGLIMDEKHSGGILWVQFKTDALVGQKWIPANRIKGRAQYAVTQKTAS